MNIIVKMIFGSHLYGTNTPESDTDYKVVFMPTAEQILLGEIPKGNVKHSKENKHDKNTKDDTDIEYFSLHRFIELALEGQTEQLDMLHAPDHCILEKNHIWDFIVKNRHRFYTRDLHSFVEYARKQAAKYGIKGSRLNAAKQVYDILCNFHPLQKLEEAFDVLPINDYCQFLHRSKSTVIEYEVCNKKLQATAKIGYCRDVVKRFYDNYGLRAMKAARNEGIDWKAVSHAIRASMQLKMIFTEGTITYPLPEADYLIKVKQGELDYSTEVAPRLEGLADELVKLSKESDLPIEPNFEYWRGFLISHAKEQIL